MTRRGEDKALEIPNRMVRGTTPFRVLSDREKIDSDRRIVIDPYIVYTSRNLWFFSPDPEWTRRENDEADILLIRQDGAEEPITGLLEVEEASGVELSWACDPFHPINSVYRFTESILDRVIRMGLPAGVITQTGFSEEAVDILRRHPLSYSQVIHTTTRRDMRRLLQPDYSEDVDPLRVMTRSAEAEIRTVCRIDPIIPFISDDKACLREIIRSAVDHGAVHILARMLTFEQLKKREVHLKSCFGPGMVFDLYRLYSDIDGLDFRPRLSYRQSLFDFMRNECERCGLTFGLWQEYGIMEGTTRSLNDFFMSGPHCSGVLLPVYRRRGDQFERDEQSMGPV